MFKMTSLKASRSSYIDFEDITRATVKWAKKCTCEWKMRERKRVEPGETYAEPCLSPCVLVNELSECFPKVL